MDSILDTIRQVKDVVGLSTDHPAEYMSLVNVEDHIVPLWERDIDLGAAVDKRPAAVDLEYRYSLEQFIQQSSIASDYSESSYADDFSRLSESDIEENEIRGVYLSGLQSARVRPGILEPEAHPIYVEGLAIHGGKLQCIDMSPYRDQFGILDYEWFIGIHYSCADRYDPLRVGNGSVLTVPLSAIGKYIFCRAHRRIEHQAVEELNAPEVGVYDPHVSGSLNAGYLPHDQFYDISSWCVIGPVNICDEWSLEIMHGLSEGTYTIEASLFYVDDLFRSPSLSDTGSSLGHVRLQLSYDNLSISDHGSNDGSCTVSNMRKLYNSRVFSGEGSVATLDYTDFEVEISTSSNEWLILSIHNTPPLLYYVYVKFKDQFQCAFVLYMISSFKYQRVGVHLGINTVTRRLD
uniref:Uncharacterized protein n=1 Tax=Babesia bovis TaxID=5865 RepID=A7AND6_BABBO|eukprot:XP_001611638.1 hypothetical protein [Babesia bovis T2Bo]